MSSQPQPLSYLPRAAEYIDGYVSTFRDVLAMFEIAMGKPHAVRDGMLKETLSQYRQFLLDAQVPEKQLARWRQQYRLTRAQSAEVDRLVLQMERWRTMCQEILELAPKLLQQNAANPPDSKTSAAFYIEMQCRPYASLSPRARQALPFVLPPEVTVSRQDSGDDIVYAFNHDELGFLGQLQVTVVPAGVNATTQVNAQPENPGEAGHRAARKALLTDLTQRLMAGLGDITVLEGPPVVPVHVKGATEEEARLLDELHDLHTAAWSDAAAPASKKEVYERVMVDAMRALSMELLKRGVALAVMESAYFIWWLRTACANHRFAAGGFERSLSRIGPLSGPVSDILLRLGEEIEDEGQTPEMQRLGQKVEQLRDLAGGVAATAPKSPEAETAQTHTANELIHETVQNSIDRGIPPDVIESILLYGWFRCTAIRYSLDEAFFQKLERNWNIVMDHINRYMDDQATADRLQAR